MLRFAGAAASLAALSLAACGGSHSPSTEADAGGAGPVDGASEVDAGRDLRPDAGTPFGDAGPLGLPEWVPLEVGEPGTCDELEPCGGDVHGTWDVAGGCFEVAIEDTLSRCPGAEVTRREGEARGRVVFGDTRAHRVAQARVEIDIFFPEICARYYSCDMLEAAMAAAATEAWCDTEPTGDCRCTARYVSEIDDRDLYTTESNEIVSTSSGKRWAYCIDGDTLRYEDTSPSEPREPGIVTLERR